MAHIEKRTRNGRVTYRARYRDPAGREKARVFNRRVDAQRFLTEVENSKLRGTWTDPALGRVLFQEWLAEMVVDDHQPSPLHPGAGRDAASPLRPPTLRQPAACGHPAA
jgi:hypothetical protein